jgi:hypothetical protein
MTEEQKHAIQYVIMSLQDTAALQGLGLSNWDAIMYNSADILQELLDADVNPREVH